MSFIVQVTRSYTNFKEEGRARAGALFAVGKGAPPPNNGLKVITEARAKVLLESSLVRVWDPASKGVPLQLTPAPNYPGQARAKDVVRPAQTALRGAAKQREAAPPAPRPLENPAGGKTGADPSQSSSAADPPSPSVTSPARGKRKPQSLPLTTPGKSSPGPARSTPATGRGGASTKAAPASKG